MAELKQMAHNVLGTKENQDAQGMATHRENKDVNVQLIFKGSRLAENKSLEEEGIKSGSEISIRILVPKVKKLVGYGKENLAADPRNKLTASSSHGNHMPFCALPEATQLRYWQSSGPPPQWWSMELSEPKVVGRFQFQLMCYNGRRGSADFSVEASHDGMNWEEILQKLVEKAQCEYLVYEVDNKKSFRFYRICILKTIQPLNYPALSHLIMNEALLG